MVIDKIYFQIKYLLLEYDEIMEIDKEYMSTFLEECIEALKLKTDDFEDANKNIGENDTISGLHSVVLHAPVCSQSIKWTRQGYKQATRLPCSLVHQHVSLEHIFRFI